jgi:hypothetical protein
MLTDQQKIKALEKKVKALETKMLFVFEMIGASDAETYDKQLKKGLQKQDKELSAHLKG